MKPHPLRFSAILVGLLLAATLCAFTPYNNILLQNSPLAGGHFPLASFGCFLFLILVANPLLSLINHRYRFHTHEVLLIWSMVTVATGIAYTGLLRTFLINITTPVWFTTTTKGQVVIPLRLLKLYHIEKGTRAIVTATEEGILLKSVTRRAIDRLRGILMRKPGGKSFAEERAEHKRQAKEL